VGLVRLLGLSLTVLMIVQVCVIALDLVAYQCGAQPSCVGGHWWLSPLENPLFRQFPGRRIALGALLPLALIVLLVLLARTTRRRYEAVSPIGPQGSRDESAALLFRSTTWNGAELTKQLGGLHLTAALGSLGAMVAAGALPLATSPRVRLIARLLIGAALGLIALGGLLINRRRTAAVGPLLAGAALVVVLAMGLAVALPSAPSASGSLPGMERSGELVFGVQLLLLLALSVAGLAVSRAGARRERLHSVRFNVPLVLAGLAVLMAGSFLGASTIRVADLLGKPTQVAVKASSSAPVIAYPPAYTWIALAFAASVTALVVMALAVAAWTWRVPSQEAERIRRGYDRREGAWPGALSDEETWVKGIARFERLARAVKVIDLPISALVSLVLIVAGLSFLLRLDLGGWRVRPFPPLPAGLHWLSTVSTWLVSLLPLGGIALLQRSWRSIRSRRQVAILWDLGTFWPRWHHPWAPPCYAERAIPDLQHRLMRLTGERGRVILSAHSQGTLFAVIALATLPRPHLERVAMVTYGSPLSYLYRRLFPDHFGRGVLAPLAAGLCPAPDVGGLKRWRNFWRRTDPIGGPIFIERDQASDQDPVQDRELIDPWQRMHPPGEPWSRVWGHSGYREDPRFSAHIAQLSRALQADL
ncbi:MAG: hypothetical protein ACRDJF_06355, partial [Actinomycetota bacterium]